MAVSESSHMAVGEEAMDAVLNRLRRAQGQLAGVIAMIEPAGTARTSSRSSPPCHARSIEQVSRSSPRE